MRLSRQQRLSLLEENSIDISTTWDDHTGRIDTRKILQQRRLSEIFDLAKTFENIDAFVRETDGVTTTTRSDHEKKLETKTSEFRQKPWVEVDLDQLRQNLTQICDYTSVPSHRIIAVLKDNAYGMGAAHVARTLQESGVRAFAVATIDEAVFLREKNVEGEILVLGRARESDMDIAQDYDLSLAIVDKDCLDLFAVAQMKRPLKLHLNVDTGMNRHGLPVSSLENAQVQRQLRALAPSIRAVFTHFHSADDPTKTATEGQRKRFEHALSLIEQLGIDYDFCHSSNSGATENFDVPTDEWLRPGIILYGCGPDPQRDPCINTKEVLSLYSTINSIRDIDSGDGVGYGHTWHAEKGPTRIATVPTGYGDGYPRSLGNKREVLIRGRRYPIVGRVMMDYVMVDLGHDSTVKVGDRVTLVGTDGNERITINELASLAGTIGYELLCRFSGQIDHIYLSRGEEIETIKRVLF